jgi:steroid delta-isomerase-like uncharacterized protein
MNVEQNKALLRRYLEAWGRGDTRVMWDMLSADHVTHNLATGKVLGVDFEIEACQIWHAAFSHTELTIEQLVTEGDTVSAHWTLTGTHTGSFVGVSPTGKRVQVAGMEINRIIDGKIVEIWRLSDTMTLMQQIGAV